MGTFQKVLLVDDDDIVNSINSVIIKHAKFATEVESINNVQTAIDFLKTTGDTPDVIFLDLNMPGLDGWDFMEEYEKLNITDGTKVIMLTSSISAKDEERASSSKQIAAFISKPLSPELLEKIYSSHLISS
ncbi:response regulator [Ekhidna sp.]